MARVEIVQSLVHEIQRRFSKAEAHKVLDLMQACEDHPRKGKTFGSIAGIVIKELKYKKFRFYFISDGFALQMIDEAALTDLLLRFVRMSDKKRQQHVIDEIKDVLKRIGPGGFS